MSKIAYLLRPASKRNGEAPVSVVHRHQGSDFVKATGVAVKPQNFNAATGKVKSADSLSPEKNGKIQAVAADIERAARNVRAKGLEPRKEAVSAEYDDIVTTREIKEGVKAMSRPFILDIVANLRADIEDLRAELAAKELQLAEYLAAQDMADIPKAVLFTDLIGAHVAQHKYRSLGWKRTLSHLIKIIGDYNPQLRLEDITLQTLQELQDFQVKAGYRNNSVRSFMGKIKGLYSEFAEDAGLDTKFLRKFTGLKEIKNENVIFLNAEQLAEIESLQLSRVQNEVRDQFLFLCEVGIRHQDIANVSRADVQLSSYVDSAGETIQRHELRVTMQKVPKPVLIPLSARALSILERNDYRFKAIVNTYFNRILKALSAKAETMRKLHTVTNYIGNRAKQEAPPLHHLISSHAGRKTFINTCMLKGVSQSTVATWVGHKDLEMIHKHYSNKDAQAAAEAYKIL